MFRLDVWPALARTMERPKARGKYLYLGEEKFFIRGVTYGPFPENEYGEPLPALSIVESDFQMMRMAGINTIRVYYVPPRWLMDTAARFGIHVLVGIPWPQHLCFLDQWEVKEDIKDKIRDAVRSLRGHPAVLAYVIGNEIPAHIVRWHGAAKVESFLEELCSIARKEDPAAMITYANYPSSEYLRLPFLDFLSVNVYLHEREKYRAYVKRLQNLASDTPLVLSEFGMDSIREGTEEVAETLAWQIADAFELGVSGTVVFSWTDEWFTGGNLVEDWAFGLVDANRRPKPAYSRVAQAYTQPLPALPEKKPMISVVICAYNAESTIEGCLASFAKLDYPNFEVVLVDDGSTDRTGEIADRFIDTMPFLHVIHQPNLGLSAARNVGFRASKGEIVAYTDSDCYVDPHWLHYMALAFQDERFAAIGGPNLPPPEDNRTAACVAVSPGAPTHVLVTDDIAEHIPGCNMAFRREILQETEGFDVAYRCAGDDVDICWRIQDKGYLIGFSAAMFVWHHRRCTVRAYLKQQKGYGRSEAMLIPKHAERFNALGNSRWAGRIYGDISSRHMASKPIIYHGAFGMGLFQTIYEPKGSLLGHIPLSFEWMLSALTLGGLGVLSGYFFLLCGLMLLTSLVFAANRAKFARLPQKYDSFGSRAIIALLTLSQPWLRGWVRYKTLLSLRLRIWRRLYKGEKHGRVTRSAPKQKLGEGFMRPGFAQRLRDGLSLLWHRFSFQRYFWNNKGLEREHIIDHVAGVIKNLGMAHRLDTGYSRNPDSPPWDFQIRSGVWTILNLRVTAENHGGEKRFVRLGGKVNSSSSALSVSLTLFTVAITSFIVGFPLLTLSFGLLFGMFIFWVLFEHGQTASFLTMLTQNLMFCKSGSSWQEPVEPKKTPETSVPIELELGAPAFALSGLDLNGNSLMKSSSTEQDKTDDNIIRILQ